MLRLVPGQRHPAQLQVKPVGERAPNPHRDRTLDHAAGPVHQPATDAHADDRCNPREAGREARRAHLLQGLDGLGREPRHQQFGQLRGDQQCRRKNQPAARTGSVAPHLPVQLGHRDAGLCVVGRVSRLQPVRRCIGARREIHDREGLPQEGATIAPPIGISCAGGRPLDKRVICDAVPNSPPPDMQDRAASRLTRSTVRRCATFYARRPMAYGRQSPTGCASRSATMRITRELQAIPGWLPLASMSSVLAGAPARMSSRQVCHATMPSDRL